MRWKGGDVEKLGGDILKRDILRRDILRRDILRRDILKSSGGCVRAALSDGI